MPQPENETSPFDQLLQANPPSQESSPLDKLLQAKPSDPNDPWAPAPVEIPQLNLWGSVPGHETTVDVPLPVPGTEANWTGQSTALSDNPIGVWEAMSREMLMQKPGAIVPGWVKKALPVAGLAGYLGGPALGTATTLSGSAISGGIGSAENLKIKQAMRRLTKDEYPSKQQTITLGGPIPSTVALKNFTRDEDEKLVGDYFEWIDEASRRGVTAWGQIATGISDLAPFMAEFAASGGAFKLGSKATQAAFARVMGEGAMVKYAGKAFGGIVGAGTQAAALPGQVAEIATDRQARAAVGLRPEEGWASSAMKGWASVAVEQGTERLGQTVFAPMQNKLGTRFKKTKLGQKVETLLQRGWMSKAGGTASEFYKKIKTATGWSDMIGEVGEEWVASVLHSALGTEDTSAGYDAGFWQRVGASQADFAKTFPVTLGVLAAPAIAFGAMHRLMRVPPQTPESKSQILVQNVRNMDEDQKAVRLGILETKAHGIQADPVAGTPNIPGQILAPIEKAEMDYLRGKINEDQLADAAELAEIQDQPEQPEVTDWQKNYTAAMDQGMESSDAALSATELESLRVESDSQAASEETPPTMSQDQRSEPAPAPNTTPTETEPSIPEDRIYGQFLSDQPLTKGIRNRILGQIRKQLWESPVIQSIADLYDHLDEHLTFRVPKKIATDVREAVESIFDPKIRAAVKKRISYAKSKDEVVHRSPDTVIEQVKESLGNSAETIESINDLIDLMEIVESGKNRSGPISAAVRRRIKSSPDLLIEHLLSLERKLTDGKFGTIGDIDRETIDSMEGQGIGQSGFADMLFSFQNLEENKVSKIKESKTREDAITRLAIQELAMEKRRAAETAAAEVLQANGVSEIVFTDEMPEHPGDDTPFEKRDGRPVGAFYINEDGQAVVALALGADSRTGYHEAYHALSSGIKKRDRVILDQTVGDEESQARSFADYAVGRSQPDKVLKRIWDSLLDVVQRIRNGLHGLGFRTAKDVFGDIHEGRYSWEQDETRPARQAQFSTDSFEFTTEEIEARRNQIKIRMGKKRPRVKLARPQGLHGDTQTPSMFEQVPDLPDDVVPIDRDNSVVGPGIHSPEWYQGQIANLKKTSKWQQFKDGWENAGMLASELLEAMSDRLKNISPYLWAQTRKHVFDSTVRTAEWYDALGGFLKGYRSLGKKQKAEMDMALDNRDSDHVNRLTAGNADFQAGVDAARNLFDYIHEMARTVGIELGYLSNFWPRYIKDHKGFNRFFGRKDFPVLERAIQDRFPHRVPTDEERAQLIGELLRTGKIYTYLSRRQNTLLARKIRDIGGDLHRFYHDSASSAMFYVHEMSQRIAKAEFFGRVNPDLQAQRRLQRALRTRIGRLWTANQGEKTPEQKTVYAQKMMILQHRLTRASDKIENFQNAPPEQQILTQTARMVQKGELDPAQERETYNILLALMNPKHPGGFIKWSQNMAYLTLLTNPISAIQNFKELWIAYNKDPILAAHATLRVFSGKTQVMMRSMGNIMPGEEYQPMGLYKLTRIMMGASLFRGMDIVVGNIGSETAVLGYQRRAKDPSRRQALMSELTPTFGNRAPAVLRALQNNTVTPEIKLLAFNSLSDIRPTSALEEPEWAARHPTGRVFYSLRRVTLRQMNYAIQQIREAPDLSTKMFRAVRMAFWMSMFGITIDIIRDVLRGRELKSLPDYFYDNLLSFVCLSRYGLQGVVRDGMEGAWDILRPPWRFLDDMAMDAKDAYDLMTDETGEFEKDFPGFRSPRNIPIVGVPYDQWFGRGREMEDRRQAKERRKASSEY